MASTEINRIMDNLRIRLPGAVDELMKLELFNTLNDFFQDTNLWRVRLQFSTEVGARSYSLAPLPSSAYVRLISLIDSKGLGVSATMDVPGTIILATVPNTVQQLVAELTLTVDDPMSVENYPICPDWALNKYQNDIVDGVLGRMMSQAAKPYSNTQLALYHARSFRSAVAVARMEANRRNIYGAQSWVYPQQFARRSRGGGVSGGPLAPVTGDQDGVILPPAANGSLGEYLNNWLLSLPTTLPPVAGEFWNNGGVLSVS